MPAQITKQQKTAPATSGRPGAARRGTAVLDPVAPSRPGKGTFFALVDDVLRANGRRALGAVQRRIVEVRDSDEVLQILAGPGSGKTEVIVWRVLYEVVVRGTEPSRLMVTTFTRKAAQELSVRLVERGDALLAAGRGRGIEIADPRVHDLRIGTIHALCDRLLAEFDEEHLEHGTTLIDATETRIRLARVRNWLFANGGRRVLDQVLDHPELSALFRPPWLDHLSTLQRVDLALSVLNQHIETWIPRCEAANIPNGVESVHGPQGLTDDLKWLAERWESYLDDHNVLDFAGLQRRFLERQPLLASEVDHVFVDEFQDTNPIQYAIHLGWAKHGNVRLTGVGDDDQALYRWRGSDIACFANLERDCAASGFAYRREVLEENHRSTERIVDFAQAFRDTTVLAAESLPKTVRAPRGARRGAPVRLLEGPWGGVCSRVAAEVQALGAGRPPLNGADPPPTVAVLMASTAELESRRSVRPALELSRALRAAGLRVYNPRNKAAAAAGSPVHALLGLISYLVDPVSKAPAGKNGRSIEVYASQRDAAKAARALSAPPAFFISEAHASVQKQLIKASGTIDQPGPDIAPLLDYLDEVRGRLIDASRTGGTVRLTLTGLVARLLRMEPFRSSGYSVALFRQALFTQLLEANVAATRQTKNSLDRPLSASLDSNGKYVWGPEFWGLLNVFGQLVAAGGQDDLEVEAFADNAIALLTFHQAKGLEFDHVYVALTGKEPDPAAALATELFSGKATPYRLDAEDKPATRSSRINRLAAADREREVYVAITRAKERLTVLHAPGDDRWAMQLNDGLAALFAGAEERGSRGVKTKEWRG